MQDRVGFSERAMQMLKEELVSTISKYMEIEEELFDLELNAAENATVLNLSIPVLRAKDDEEIDKAIKEQAIKTEAKAQEIVQELEELIKERAAELAGVEEDKTAQEEKPAEEASEEENKDQEENSAQDEAKEGEDEPTEPIEAAEEDEVKEEKTSSKKAKVKEN